MTRYEFELPDPGEGLTEAEILEWHAEEGDEVQEDQTLGEVETDKAVTEIPSPCSGTIEKLSASEGETVEVGETIVVFETGSPPKGDVMAEKTAEAEEPDKAEETDEAEPEEAVEKEESKEEETGEEEIEEVAERTDEKATDGESAIEVDEQAGKVEAEGAEAVEEDRVFAAPRTRRYAREEDIDLSKVEGSGPEGRVLQEDINEHLEGAEPIVHPTVEVEPVSIDEDEARATRRDLSGLRERIAESMTRSKTIVPHLTSGFEADATELVALKERLDEKHDARITYTPLFVKAIVPALREFPIVNASLDDTTNEIVEKHYYNVGFATHTDDGLIVPVIKNVDSKPIVEVATELHDLAEQARERSIDAADLQGGTFTVTNLATYGEHRTFGTPVINHPEAAILGIGRIRKKPVVTEDEIEARERIGLTLSYDHRLIDGAVANQFMEHVIETIEDPDLLLSRL